MYIPTELYSSYEKPLDNSQWHSYNNAIDMMSYVII